jgi:hypothetical protein
MPQPFRIPNMNTPTSNSAQAQDAPAKAAYQTPELVDYGSIAVTTQGQVPTELQNGSGGDVLN